MGIVGVEEGHSGYFSVPSNVLDPRLFNGDLIRPEVRAWIINSLYQFWEARYDYVELWSTVWLAGSGISYQWNADRGNGDLDVLIGVDWPAFFHANPDLRGIGAASMSAQFNAEFHAELWPKTATTTIGISGAVNSARAGEFSGIFEVTFYVNAEGTDIRDLHPYAAYNLTDNGWTVRPPVLPYGSPERLYPTEWWDYVHDERRMAESLIQRYNHVQGQVAVQRRGSPAYSTGARQLQVVRDQISSLYDDIHTGRRRAFSEQGQGYGDFYNFRWQAHKKFGTQAALHAIWSANASGREAEQISLYGEPLASAEQALRTASLWNRRPR